MIGTYARPDRTVVYRPWANLDGVATVALRHVVHPALQPGAEVVIDLSRVEYIDADGLSALVGFARRARSVGATLRVSNPRPRVRWRIELVGVGDLRGAASACSHDAA